MPTYVYECDKGHKQELVMRISEHSSVGNIVTCSCGLPAYQSYKNVNVGVFKPFTTDAFTGKPIKVETKEQRDKLCAKHHLTMDSNRYHRKVKFRSPVEDLDFAQVKAVAERGKLDDGTPIQGTVAKELTDD